MELPNEEAHNDRAGLEHTAFKVDCTDRSVLYMFCIASVEVAYDTLAMKKNPVNMAVCTLEWVICAING